VSFPGGFHPGRSALSPSPLVTPLENVVPVYRFSPNGIPTPPNWISADFLRERENAKNKWQLERRARVISVKEENGNE